MEMWGTRCERERRRGNPNSKNRNQGSRAEGIRTAGRRMTQKTMSMVRCFLPVLRGTQAFKGIKVGLAGSSVNKSTRLCKCKALSLNPQHPCKILGMSALACNSSIGGKRGAAPDIALACLSIWKNKLPVQ